MLGIKGSSDMSNMVLWSKPVEDAWHDNMFCIDKEYIIHLLDQDIKDERVAQYGSMLKDGEKL
jgi:hypothetical protein